MRKALKGLSVVCLFLCTLLFLIACGGSGVGVETDMTTGNVTGITVGSTVITEKPETIPYESTSAHETTLSPETTNVVETIDVNENTVSAGSETIGQVETTVPETVPETTMEPETMPADMPTDAQVLSFVDASFNKDILSVKMAAYEITDDETYGSVLKLSSMVAGSPYVQIDYAAYMELAGLDAAAWNDCKYAVIRLKTEATDSTSMTVTLSGKQEKKTVKVDAKGAYDSAKTDWQCIAIPLVTEQKDDTYLSLVRINFLGDNAGKGETVYIESVTFTSDTSKALELTGESLVNPLTYTITVPGLQNEYKLLHVTDLHASAYYDEEVKNMDATRAALVAQRRSAFMGGILRAEDRMPIMFSYADEIKADLLLLSGDILDFPSQMNLDLLRQNLANTKTPGFFTLGNHDWCYGDSDYFSQNAIQNQIPLFNDMSVGEPKSDPYFHYVEYEDLIVATVDNSRDSVTAETVDKFLALWDKNKPIILMIHVPLHVDSLVADCTKVWGKDLAIGGDTGLNASNQNVQRLYQAVAEDENTPVVAVIAGHVHFNHEDVLPNGVPQIITSTAYTGDCRIITVTGEEAE